MELNNTVSVILPGVVVAGAAIVVFLADLFLKRKGALAWIAVAGLLCGAAVAVGQWGEWTARFAVWRVFTGGLTFGRREAMVGFAGMIGNDRYAVYAVVLFCAIGVLAVLLSDAYLARRKAARGEFYGLLLLIVTGMIGMAISTDIIAFFVSFELMSLPTYILAGYIWRDPKSTEASLKYFVTGAFSSAILAFGLALLYLSLIHI